MALLPPSLLFLYRVSHGAPNLHPCFIKSLLQPLPVVANLGGRGICPAHRFTVELPPGLLEKNIQLGNLAVPPAHAESRGAGGHRKGGAHDTGHAKTQLGGVGS